MRKKSAKISKNKRFLSTFFAPPCANDAIRTYSAQSYPGQMVRALLYLAYRPESGHRRDFLKFIFVKKCESLLNSAVLQFF